MKITITALALIVSIIPAYAWDGNAHLEEQERLHEVTIIELVAPNRPILRDDEALVIANRLEPAPEPLGDEFKFELVAGTPRGRA